MVARGAALRKRHSLLLNIWYQDRLVEPCICQQAALAPGLPPPLAAPAPAPAPTPLPPTPRSPNLAPKSLTPIPKGELPPPLGAPSPTSVSRGSFGFGFGCSSVATACFCFSVFGQFKPFWGVRSCFVTETKVRIFWSCKIPIFNSWVVAGTEICKWATRSLVEDGLRN